MDKSVPRWIALAVALFAAPLSAADFYVTPNGTLSGNGSTGSPWNLTKAFSHPSSVHPGDTIWLRGGTYTGHWSSVLRGEPGKPIIVRQYPGERVTFDGVGSGNVPTLNVRGQYTWFWGFEITNTDPVRTLPSGGTNTRGTAVSLASVGSKLINMTIHDTGQGVLAVTSAPDAEINGCLIYYNGFDGADRGHGHGIYVQNETGSKRIVDNIMFEQFGWGIHGYTESSQIDNMHFEGNTAFNNGLLSHVSGAQTNFLIGANGSAAATPDESGKVAKQTFLISNYSYFSGEEGVAANLGYSKGIASPTVIDNYLVGGRALALINAFRPITLTGNTLYGTVSGFDSSEFPSNTYLTSRPTGLKVFVRPNQYEPGRAHITIYNWDQAPAVSVSLKGILKAGTPYELRNAQNYYGPPVLSGTYDGNSSLHIPMDNLAPAAPVGLPAPTPTGREFQVFIVVPKPPASNGKPPTAAFSYGPRLPVAGEEVRFDDRSTGSFSTRQWDFGDPGSGTDNGSQAEAPTHSYSEPGTYTVRLTLANDGGSSTRTRDVTVTASPGSRTATIPVVGHVLGATGTTFLSDVSIGDPASAPVVTRLVFSPSGEDPPLESTLTLAAGETRLLADVVSSEFGVSNALGSLRVETEGTPPAALRLAGRTYVQDGGATLGFGAAGVSAADALTGDRFVSNLAISDGFRTNLGAMNGTDGDLAFVIQLLDGAGNILGKSTRSLAAGKQQQWSLSQLFPAASGTGLTARLVTAGGGLAPLAYAAVTDNVSSDPTYYAARGPAPVQFVPGIASITGVGGAFFRSELSIANSGRGPATVTLTFLEHDRNNTSAPTRTYVLGPLETLHFDDALSTLFGVSDTYGALIVQSDTSPGVTVFERILTDATTTAGTVGQQTDAVSAEDLSTSGSLLGVRQDDDFRTNVGLLNPGSGNATVRLRLVQSPASELGSTEIVLPPRGYIQRNLSALFPDAVLPPGETLSIELESVNSASSLFAFASVIDNVSQDPTFYPEQP